MSNYKNLVSNGFVILLRNFIVHSTPRGLTSVIQTAMGLKADIINELHRPARRQFPRRNTVIKGINDLFQADLIEVRPYSRLNKGYNYILTVINCFTKVADALPLKDKSAQTVANAMSRIILRSKHKIKHLQTDDGKEYFNKIFANLMHKYNINHYSTKSEKKAAIIERFNRTIKGAIFKKFSERGAYIWHDMLPTLIHEYNNKYHRTIGMKPISVNKNNEKIVLNRIKRNTMPKNEKMHPRKFFEGDKVRISKYKGIFSKRYLPNWTNEVFTVHKVQPTVPETYILKDNKDEILQGGFYGHELLKSYVGDVYLVEKIIKRKKDKVLVRWLGFDKNQDSWISKTDLI